MTEHPLKNIVDYGYEAMTLEQKGDPSWRDVAESMKFEIFKPAVRDFYSNFNKNAITQGGVIKNFAMGHYENRLKVIQSGHNYDPIDVSIVAQQAEQIMKGTFNPDLFPLVLEVDTANTLPSLDLELVEQH